MVNSLSLAFLHDHTRLGEIRQMPQDPAIRTTPQNQRFPECAYEPNGARDCRTPDTDNQPRDALQKHRGAAQFFPIGRIDRANLRASRREPNDLDPLRFESPDFATDEGKTHMGILVHEVRDFQSP
jgi:hypothetical protein